MEPKKTRATEAFFGRRHGKPLREHQRQLQSSLLPELMLDLAKPAPEDLTRLFSKPVEKIRIEIGFGGGEHLLHEADRFPEVGFIGVEPFVNGMAKLLAGVDHQEERKGHLRLYNDDATVLLDWLPENSIDGIDLFYPDPWPKKKHWKRRFVNQRNLERFAGVLKDGAPLRFASDIDTYVNWTLLHCHDHPAFFWQASSSHDWHTPYEAWPGTRYEAKAFREGRKAAYLTFLRTSR